MRDTPRNKYEGACHLCVRDTIRVSRELLIYTLCKATGRTRMYLLHSADTLYYLIFHPDTGKEEEVSPSLNEIAICSIIAMIEQFGK